MKAVSERQRAPVVTSQPYILGLYYKVIALPLIICHQGAYITLCNLNGTTSSSEMTLGTLVSKSVRTGIIKTKSLTFSERHKSKRNS